MIEPTLMTGVVLNRATRRWPAIIYLGTFRWIGYGFFFDHGFADNDRGPP